MKLHERMHRTLKRGTARPPAPTRRSQQRRFDAFRVEYNTVRPHEALQDETPASLYPRPDPSTLSPLEYPTHYEVRLVSRNGGLRWQSQWVNVTHVLGGEYVGLVEIDDGEWDVYFGPRKLGRFHERLLRVEDALVPATLPSDTRDFAMAAWQSRRALRKGVFGKQWMLWILLLCGLPNITELHHDPPDTIDLRRPGTCSGCLFPQ